MIQLAWRMLHHQPDCTLVRWYRERVEKANGAGKKTFIVALAHKLLIALWRFVAEGGFPAGTVSGAPKVRAMQVIDELEPERRGIYSGSATSPPTARSTPASLCAPPSSRTVCSTSRLAVVSSRQRPRGGIPGDLQQGPRLAARCRSRRPASRPFFEASAAILSGCWTCAATAIMMFVPLSSLGGQAKHGVAGGDRPTPAR